MAAVLNVFILSDGLGNEFWTLGLDDHKATQAQNADRALGMLLWELLPHCENVNKSLTIKSGKLSRNACCPPLCECVAHFEPALMEALKHCDSGSFVSRHRVPSLRLPICSRVRHFP